MVEVIGLLQVICFGTSNLFDLYGDLLGDDGGGSRSCILIIQRQQELKNKDRMADIMGRYDVARSTKANL